MNNKECMVCGNCNQSIYLENIIGSDNKIYSISLCNTCGVGYADANLENIDYTEYGQHLTNNTEEYFINKSTKISIFKKILFFYIKKKYHLSARILDFGSGAGFFVKNYENYGFKNTYGLEISEKLLKVAREKVKINNQLTNLNEITENFQVISMMDVIEHLPTEINKNILVELVSKLEKGGIFIGSTPNINSLNLTLFKEKDPVIDPPSHVLYFNTNGLDKYFKTLGLRKLMLFTEGFNTNSFFRKEKFRKSWIEKPNKYQKPFSFLIRLSFKITGFVLSLFGKGYHIFYIYVKE